MTRTIFHVDMDAFFVSVEELFDPRLKGKAVVVGGMPDQRGVVSAASYEARKFGIHSAMPLAEAYKLCPHAIFLSGRRAAYAEYSKGIKTILEGFCPVVEMVSIDEAYLDFTGFRRLYGHPLALAERLREQIQKVTGLSASIGVSSSRLVSKVASDLAKPHGILYVLPDHEAVFLAPLPVSKLPGVGKVSEQKMRELGILRVEQLAELGKTSLSGILGRWGEALYQMAVGRDPVRFAAHDEPKTISHEHTFEKDSRNSDEIQTTIAHLVQKTAHRLREHKMVARIVTLKLRDRKFKTKTRATSLKEPTQLDEEILKASFALLFKHWDTRTEIRLIGVALSGLSFGGGQENLFTQERRDRMSRIYEAADKVRERFGFNAISSGRTTK